MKAAQSPRMPKHNGDPLLHLVQNDVHGCESAMGQHGGGYPPGAGCTAPTVSLRGSAGVPGGAPSARLAGAGSARRPARPVASCREASASRARRGLGRCRRPCAGTRARRFRASRVGSDMRLDEACVASARRCRCRALGPHRGDALLLGDLDGMRLEAGDGRDVHVGMRDRHEVVPDGGGEMTAGVAVDAIGRLSSLPSQTRADVLAGEADEPDVLRAR